MNVCVVGYGAIGGVHADVLENIPGVDLYGICDADRSRAILGAERHNCKAFGDFYDCIADKSVDSIHIATPHYLHYEMITQAAKCGKIVFVEKPVVMKPDELVRLYGEYADFPIYPIFQNRTNKCVRFAASSDGLGALAGARALLTWHRDAAYYNSAPWRGTAEFEGGGVLINQAIHTLDLLIFLGGDIDSVTASVSNKSLGGVIEVEDTADAFLKFKNGASGVFYATNSAVCGGAPFAEFKFENAVLRYSDGKLYRDGECVCCDDADFRGKSYWGIGHERLFYDYYVNGRAFTLKDAENTMKTVFAIYKSAKTGREEKV